jgi:ssDNA-binding Zn-finger/Zn-ribbon topoisomerase 1
MQLKKPDSMEECLYFTNRSIGEGSAIAWVYRKECPKCKKGRLGKPIKKNGKADKKADYYECPLCKYQEKNEVVESGLVVEIEYKCPFCGNEGQTTTDYKRKAFEGVPAFVFECEKCHKKIGVTKKLKEPKKKGKVEAEEATGDV